MRKIFVLLLLVVPLFCKGQYVNVIYPKVNNSGIFENDSIRVKFEYDTDEFVKFSLYNKTNERIYIEWDNFRIENSAIAFDDDRRFTMNQRKEDEAVASESNSQNKSITMKDNVRDNYIVDFMKGNAYRVIIPIRYGNKSIDYKVKIEFLQDLNRKLYPTCEDIEKITIGMGNKELDEIFQFPSKFEGGYNELIFRYRNGLKIHFKESTEKKKIRKIKGNFVVVSIDKSEIIDGDIETLKF